MRSALVAETYIGRDTFWRERLACEIEKFVWNSAYWENAVTRLA
jgi:hypothetical protein